MRLVDHPEAIAAWPTPTIEAPWRALRSGCLAGWGCGVDGSDYGMGQALASLEGLETLVWVGFCPEDIGLGTPRTMPDIHGGDGFDVLAGQARVLDEHGTDLTEGMVRGAHAMVAAATQADVRFAVLTDMSGACGTQVISDGCRFDEPRRYQRGAGVAAAALSLAGIPVVSQRDLRTLSLLRARLDPTYARDTTLIDHHAHPWTQAHLPEPRTWPRAGAHE